MKYLFLGLGCFYLLCLLPHVVAKNPYAKEIPFPNICKERTTSYGNFHMWSSHDCPSQALCVPGPGGAAVNSSQSYCSCKHTFEMLEEDATGKHCVPSRGSRVYTAFSVLLITFALLICFACVFVVVASNKLGVFRWDLLMVTHFIVFASAVFYILHKALSIPQSSVALGSDTYYAIQSVKVVFVGLNAFFVYIYVIIYGIAIQAVVNHSVRMKAMTGEEVRRKALIFGVVFSLLVLIPSVPPIAFGLLALSSLAWSVCTMCLSFLYFRALQSVRSLVHRHSVMENNEPPPAAKTLVLYTLQEIRTLTTRYCVLMSSYCALSFALVIVWYEGRRKRSAQLLGAGYASVYVLAQFVILSGLTIYCLFMFKLVAIRVDTAESRRPRRTQ